MKLFSHFWNPISLTSLLATWIFLNGCNHAPESTKRPNMTALTSRLQPLFETMKTVCFGNFIIEVPATATMVSGPTSVDWPIDRYPGEGDKVSDRVTKALSEIEKHRDYLRKGSEFVGETSWFGKVVDGAMPGQKLVFGSKDHVFYSIESFIPVGKDLFIQRAGSVLSKESEIRVLNTVAQNLRPRPDSEVPTDSGSCIDGGFLSWQGGFERASLGIRLSEFPDVHFSIQAIKNQGHLIESSALEPRLERVAKEGRIWCSRVKFFRRGSHQPSTCREINMRFWQT